MKYLGNVNRALLVGAAALALNVGLSSSASAQLTIVRNFTGGSPPGNMAGGGNLNDLFNAAADWWERTLCSPTHQVRIDYGWGSLGGSVLGVHTLVAQGGTPNRETRGRITFDNDGSSVFYADPNPEDNEEYAVFAPISQDLGGGEINTARFYRNALGAAAGRIDLFSVVLHEIGHALGLSSANQAYQQEISGDNEIDVTSPRPNPGTKIPTTPGSAHLNVFRTLMSPSVSVSTRPVVSGADVLTNGQLSKYVEMMLQVPVAGTSFVRNGSGVNPMGFVEVSPAVIGQTWSTTVDLSNGAASSMVFLGRGGPVQIATNWGELLAGGPHFVVSIAAGVHDANLPFDCTLVGREVQAQATTLGPPPAQLQNALQLLVGSH